MLISIFILKEVFFDLTTLYLFMAIFLIFFIVILIQLRNLFVQINKTTTSINDYQTEVIKPQLSTYELERVKQAQSFDERILKLRGELSSKNPAEILDKNVYNLPHTIITESDIYREEVAE